jgi:hypothetical protein
MMRAYRSAALSEGRRISETRQAPVLGRVIRIPRFSGPEEDLIAFHRVRHVRLACHQRLHGDVYSRITI